jgi:hypothetical protein
LSEILRSQGGDPAARTRFAELDPLPFRSKGGPSGKIGDWHVISFPVKTWIGYILEIRRAWDRRSIATNRAIRKARRAFRSIVDSWQQWEEDSDAWKSFFCAAVPVMLPPIAD